MSTLLELKRAQKALVRADAAAAVAKEKHQQAVQRVRDLRAERVRLLVAYINKGGADVFRDAADALLVSVPRVYQLYYGYAKSR